MKKTADAQSTVITDDHRQPFSLFATLKRFPNNIALAGDAREIMDKSIGRMVYRAKGEVSSKNVVNLNHLDLAGPVFIMQLCLIEPHISTIHFEVSTKMQLPLRVTFSTLYGKDPPTFLGRSIRLPLPPIYAWMNLVVDLDEILQTYCKYEHSSTPMQLGKIKRIEVCSNTTVRDIVMIASLADTEQPKLLSVKPGVEVPTIFYSEQLLPQASQSRTASSPNIKPVIGKQLSEQKSSSPAADRPQQKVNGSNSSNQINNSPPSRGGLLTSMTASSLIKSFPSQHIDPDDDEESNDDDDDEDSQHRNRLQVAQGSEDEDEERYDGEDDEDCGEERVPVDLEEGEEELKESSSGELAMKNDTVADIPPTPPQQINAPVEIISLEAKGSVAAVAVLPPRTPSHQLSKDMALSVPASAATLKIQDLNESLAIQHDGLHNKENSIRQIAANESYPHTMTTPDMSRAPSLQVEGVTATAPPKPIAGNEVRLGANEKLLTMEMVMGYISGPAALLYNSRMLIHSVGSYLVITDLDRGTEASERPNFGLWKVFVSVTANASSSSAGEGNGNVYRQTLLKGHQQTIVFIEVSKNDCWMVTVDSSGDVAMMILWDLKVGSRVASIRPHAGKVISVSINAQETQIATAGYDSKGRCQVIVWDIKALSVSQGVVTSKDTNNPAILGKQISDFSLTKMCYNLCEDNQLVSCGRENVRLWRIHRSHLPARPVQLNAYARSITYTDISFDTDKKHIYIASNRGLVLRINGETLQVLNAFELHKQQINCIRVHSSYCITGSDDSLLRVWPLDFKDFLLEARHEGSIHFVATHAMSQRIVIGTSAGTLGILDLPQHRYETVVRSHNSSVLRVSNRAASDTFITVGVDNTIRIWNPFGVQIVEFWSEADQPTAIGDMDSPSRLICGFKSGYLRVFDVATAACSMEKKCLSSAVERLLYSSFEGDWIVVLYASNVIHVHDVQDNLRLAFEYKFANTSDGSSGSKLVISAKGDVLIHELNGKISFFELPHLRILLDSYEVWSPSTAGTTGRKNGGTPPHLASFASLTKSSGSPNSPSLQETTNSDGILGITILEKYNMHFLVLVGIKMIKLYSFSIDRFEGISEIRVVLNSQTSLSSDFPWMRVKKAVFVTDQQLLAFILNSSEDSANTSSKSCMAAAKFEVVKKKAGSFAVNMTRPQLLTAFEATVNDVTWSPSRSQLITATSGGYLAFWRTNHTSMKDNHNNGEGENSEQQHKVIETQEMIVRIEAPPSTPNNNTNDYYRDDNHSIMSRSVIVGGVGDGDGHSVISRSTLQTNNNYNNQTVDNKLLDLSALAEEVADNHGGVDMTEFWRDELLAVVEGEQKAATLRVNDSDMITSNAVAIPREGRYCTTEHFQPLIPESRSGGKNDNKARTSVTAATKTTPTVLFTAIAKDCFAHNQTAALISDGHSLTVWHLSSNDRIMVTNHDLRLPYRIQRVIRIAMANSSNSSVSVAVVMVMDTENIVHFLLWMLPLPSPDSNNGSGTGNWLSLDGIVDPVHRQPETLFSWMRDRDDKIVFSSVAASRRDHVVTIDVSVLVLNGPAGITRERQQRFELPGDGCHGLVGVVDADRREYLAFSTGSCCVVVNISPPTVGTSDVQSTVWLNDVKNRGNFLSLALIVAQQPSSTSKAKHSIPSGTVLLAATNAAAELHLTLFQPPLVSSATDSRLVGRSVMTRLTGLNCLSSNHILAVVAVGKHAPSYRAFVLEGSLLRVYELTVSIATGQSIRASIGGLRKLRLAYDPHSMSMFSHLGSMLGGQAFSLLFIGSHGQVGGVKESDGGGSLKYRPLWSGNNNPNHQSHNCSLVVMGDSHDDRTVAVLSPQQVIFYAANSDSSSSWDLTMSRLAMPITAPSSNGSMMMLVAQSLSHNAVFIATMDEDNKEGVMVGGRLIVARSKASQSHTNISFSCWTNSSKSNHRSRMNKETVVTAFTSALKKTTSKKAAGTAEANKQTVASSSTIKTADHSSSSSLQVSSLALLGLTHDINHCLLIVAFPEAAAIDYCVVSIDSIQPPQHLFMEPIPTITIQTSADDWNNPSILHLKNNQQLSTILMPFEEAGIVAVLRQGSSLLELYHSNNNVALAISSVFKLSAAMSPKAVVEARQSAYYSTGEEALQVKYRTAYLNAVEGKLLLQRKDDSSSNQEMLVCFIGKMGEQQIHHRVHDEDDEDDEEEDEQVIRESDLAPNLLALHMATITTSGAAMTPSIQEEGEVAANDSDSASLSPKPLMFLQRLLIGEGLLSVSWADACLALHFRHAIYVFNVLALHAVGRLVSDLDSRSGVLIVSAAEYSIGANASWSTASIMLMGEEIQDNEDAAATTDEAAREYFLLVSSHGGKQLQKIFVGRCTTAASPLTAVM